MKKIIFPTLLAFAVPLDTFAAGQTFAEFMGKFQSVISGAVPIIISFGIIAFFWGLVKYVRPANDPKAREEGRKLIVYGIIAVFVMLSMWGLVNMIVYTIFGGNDTELQPIDVPQGPF